MNALNSVQKIFERVEKKYLIDEKDYRALMERLDGKMKIDQYGKTTICNIYYDTPSHQLIRTSMEKPVYKEKLRVRSYGTPDKNSLVFVELKKKYKGVVYKRRIDMTLDQSNKFIFEGISPEKNKQIENEISYFLKYYKEIAPAMYLSYDRIALYGIEDPALRVTFDNHILYREEALELDKGIWGNELLPPDLKIMEIKIPGSMPMWLSEILDELKIYPASFSKYGEAFKKECSKKIKDGKVIYCA